MYKNTTIALYTFRKIYSMSCKVDEFLAIKSVLTIHMSSYQQLCRKKYISYKKTNLVSSVIKEILTYLRFNRVSYIIYGVQKFMVKYFYLFKNVFCISADNINFVLETVLKFEIFSKLVFIDFKDFVIN